MKDGVDEKIENLSLLGGRNYPARCPPHE